MNGTDILHPHPPEFEQFLYATVGEDRNGYVVTVLSALARLGLDPWNETAELVSLGRVAARARLETLLSRVRDVPDLQTENSAVAHNLSLLLPQTASTGGLKIVGPKGAGSARPSRGVLWTVFALVVVLLQLLFNMATGSGE